MKVEVRPLDIPKWHGKRNKESFSQPHIIEALYDPTTGGYATGLTAGEEEEYGKKLGADLSSTYHPEIPHEFYNSKMGRIKLENQTMILDDEISLDFVKIKMMKASKYVANSIKEWKDGLFPESTHVIYDEEEEIEILATKGAKRRKAIQMTLSLNKADQANIVQILTGKSIRSRSQNYIDVQIDDLIDNRIDDFLVQAQMDKKSLYVRAAVLEALQRNILTKEGTAIFYLSDKIGYDFEDTITWFEDPQNQNMKVSILEKLNKN
jgi:hypothetical protein